MFTCTCTCMYLLIHPCHDFRNANNYKQISHHLCVFQLDMSHTAAFHQMGKLLRQLPMTGQSNFGILKVCSCQETVNEYFQLV